MFRAAKLTELCFATRNGLKLLEYSSIFGEPLIQIELDLPPFFSPQTISLTANGEYAKLCELVAEKKAQDAWLLHGKRAAVVETTLLFIDCLQGFPGVEISDMDTPEARKVLTRMSSQSRIDTSRSATVGSTLALFHAETGVQLRTGILRGWIAKDPYELESFDWDTIFKPDGQSRTFSEMGPEMKNRISMRKLAADALLRNPFRLP